MTAAGFRWLVVAAWLLAVAGASLDALCPALLPEGMRLAWEAWEEAPLWLPDAPWALALLAGALGALLLLGLAACVAMCRFRAWGRSASLWITVLALPLGVWAGPGVQSGWSTALLDAAAMLWGAALAAAYWSPLARRFAPPEAA